MPNETDNEAGKAALIAAHADVLHHIPTRTGICSRCELPLPCPPVITRADVMQRHGHLVDNTERKRVENGEHECSAWIYPYQY